MNEDVKVKTAFSTERGHFHFTILPFGVTGGPSTFQRAMNNASAGLTSVKCFVYLDVVVYGYDSQDHNNKLPHVFHCFNKFNLKLQPKICFFLRKERNLLGHIVSIEGIKPENFKIFAIQNWPKPTNAKDVKSFLGLYEFYRRFIEDFANISEPLTDLFLKNISFRWIAFCEEAFDKLRNCLIKPTTLKYSKTFCITTDASNFAIGAILLQEYDDQDMPIDFASRVLNTAERNYPTIEKEFLAIDWAVVKRFRPYIYGTKFIVKTNH